MKNDVTEMSAREYKAINLSRNITIHTRLKIAWIVDVLHIPFYSR